MTQPRKREVDLSERDLRIIKDACVGRNDRDVMHVLEHIPEGHCVATRGVAKMTMSLQGRDVAVAVKQLLPEPRPNVVRREWHVFGALLETDRDERLAVPDCFGRFTSENGDYCIVSEFVDENASMSDLPTIIQALADLSTLQPAEHPKIFETIGQLKEPPINGARRGFQSREDRQDLLRLFEDGFRHRQTLSELFPEPVMALSRGDAHLNNFRKRASGEVCMIDLGGMNIRPLGWDLANLLRGKVLEPDFSFDSYVALETRAIDMLHAKCRATFQNLTREDILFGYASGMWANIQHRGKGLNQKQSEKMLKDTEVFLKILLRVQEDLIRTVSGDAAADGFFQAGFLRRMLRFKRA